MYAPIFLVLGSPLTLGLINLRPRVARKVRKILETNLGLFFVHPVTAALINIGSMYVLYLTPLYLNSMDSAIGHHLLHFHFVAAGFLFSWSLIGPDPAARRPGFKTRLMVWYISTAAHAFLSKWMYAQLLPPGLSQPPEIIEPGLCIKVRDEGCKYNKVRLFGD